MQFWFNVIGCKLYEPFAYNGLWLLRSVLFGVRSASLSQKYCNKIKQISTENYIAIFLFAETL
jgi:hypothetical protein